MLEDEELADSAIYCFNHGIAHDRLQFAASLVFNPEKDQTWYDGKATGGKTRYFSMSLQKVTRDREKQYDERYKELTQYMDGSPKSILALVTSEYTDGLEHWQNANIVRDWCDANIKNSWMELPAIQLGWFNKDHSKARDFRDAFEACRDAGQWLRIRKNAQNGVENYVGALERKTKREQEENKVTVPEE